MSSVPAVGAKAPQAVEGVSSLAKITNALSSVLLALDGLSNKEVRQVLEMAAAGNNLRVISMDRPIGQSSQPSIAKAKKAAIPVPKAQSGLKTGPIGLKANPALQGLLTQRDELLLKLKAADPSNNSVELTALREKEREIKKFREELKGKNP